MLTALTPSSKQAREGAVGRTTKNTKKNHERQKTMAIILVVEDNAANMKLARVLLEKAGHSVLTAGEGGAGVRLAREFVPDLILMDVQMPGVDGLTATRILKEDPRTKDIPIIALTALAMKGDAERIREAGCDGYIAKPLHYVAFLSEVSRMLGRCRAL